MRGSGVGLGELQMVRIVFFDVFFALNAFSQHWPQVNELRATARRLHEFERGAAAGGRAGDTGSSVGSSVALI